MPNYANRQVGLLSQKAASGHMASLASRLGSTSKQPRQGEHRVGAGPGGDSTNLQALHTPQGEAPRRSPVD